MSPELERIILAWSLSVCRSIMGADDVLDWSEVSWLGSRFPVGELSTHGLANETGKLTTAYELALAGAPERLAAELDLDQKLTLLSTFHAACLADGVLEVGEYQAMFSAARALGLSEDEISRHLNAGETAPPRRDTLRRRR